MLPEHRTPQAPRSQPNGFWLVRPFCAIGESIVRRLTLTFFLLTTLVLSAVRLPASVCAVSSAPIGKACQQGCCANKSCCAESQQNRSLPAPPLTKDGGPNHELLAIVTPSLANAIVSVRPFGVSPHSAASFVAISRPRLAVLCTFLI
jgi:hypothetical protein